MSDALDAVIKKIAIQYGKHGKISRVDGLSVDMGNWRFNLRESNTESLLRLNVESRGSRELCEKRVRELVALCQR